MEAVNQIASTINSGLKYLHDNSLVIFACVAVLWMVRGHVVERWSKSQQGVTLGSTPRTNDDRLNDMMRVRQKQQDEAEQRSKIAAQERKLKEAEEKKRRNELNLKSKKKKEEDKGNTLGSSGGGYNPLQPWSSGSGGGYKAQRRTVNRG